MTEQEPAIVLPTRAEFRADLEGREYVRYRLNCKSNTNE